ncbi:MAG: DUF6599 family protein [Myxococcales bacterium]
MKRELVSLAIVVLATSGCKRGTPSSRGDAPPPAPSATAGLCSAGGGKIGDALAAKLLPASFDGYCIDPNNEVRTYGKEGKGTIEQVCTELFDGECEVYRAYGLERVVSARYADGAGTPGNITVNLSRFDSVQNAFGFFTRRVVGDTDPAALSLDSIDAGSLGALGSGVAYVWRGMHVAELSYSNDNEAPDALKASSKRLLPVLGHAIGELLPGERELPAAARLLPEASRIKLGLVFEPKHILGITGAGPGAIGFYREGERRYRLIALERPNDQAAQDVMKTLRKVEGASEQKGPPPTVTLGMRTGAEGAKTDGAKLEWMFSRVGRVVIGIGDEEHSVSTGDKKQLQLTSAEKMAHLTSLLAEVAKKPSAIAEP